MIASGENYANVVTLDVGAESESNVLGLQKAMLDATPDCIKVLSPDGRLLTMNRAGCLALGVPEDSSFGMPWLPLLPEDVHQSGQGALRRAAAGESARFAGRSENGADVRFWDNLLTPNVDAFGIVRSILCVSRDVTEQTRLEKQLEGAMNREQLLSREMQHRVKNIFSVVSGLALIAEKEANHVGNPGVAIKILFEKLAALSRASDAAFPHPGNPEADPAQIGVASLVGSVLLPYGLRCRIAGDAVQISRDAVTNLALFLHELATNSIKYGALSADQGHVTVHWLAQDGILKLTWTEANGPPLSATPIRQGFGSGMVDRIVKSAGGTISRLWQTEGLIVRLELPILR